MASDGTELFVLFLYADIQWYSTTTSSGTQAIAQVGFNAGDGVNFYQLPGSRMTSLINITTTSNVGVPGMWVFKVSGAVIESGGCQDASESEKM